MFSGVDYVEDKGWLDSQFTISASPEVHKNIAEYLNKIKFQLEYDFFNYKVKNGKDANDFLNYVNGVIDSNCLVEVKKGWFKTKVEIFCHPTTAAKFDNWLEMLTKIKNLL